jgi:hypothetical protein
MSCDPIFDFGTVDSCDHIILGLAPEHFSGFLVYNFKGKTIRQGIVVEQGEEIKLLFKPVGLVNFHLEDAEGNKLCFEKDETKWFNAMPCEVRCEEIEVDFIPEVDGKYNLIVGNKVTEFGALAGVKMKIPNVFNFTLCEEFRIQDTDTMLDVQLPESREESQQNTYCEFLVNLQRVNEVPCVIDLCLFECVPSCMLNVCDYVCLPDPV